MNIHKWLFLAVIGFMIIKLQGPKAAPDFIENFSTALTFHDGMQFGADNKLTLEIAGSPQFDNSSLKYLNASTLKKEDAYLIRSTHALPSKYKVSVDVGEINYDLLDQADEENGMYFIGITDALPQPTTNDWFHEHRKVMIDTDNNMWGAGGTNPIFFGYYDAFETGDNDRFYDDSIELWDDDWQSVTNYSAAGWYTFSLEKTDTEYIYTVSDAATHEVMKTASILIASVIGPALPEYLSLGDPHINYYKGSAKITNIRIQDNSAVKPPATKAPPVLTEPDVAANFSAALTFSDGVQFGAGNSLTMETAGSPQFDNSSLRYLAATTLKKEDAYLIRSTHALPSKYKVCVDVGDINYNLLKKKDEENGMYFISITDSLPQPTTNDWFHEHRKVMIDTDNNSGGSGGTNPIFVGYYGNTDNGHYNDRFYNGSTNQWGGKYDWQSIANYSLTSWYTFSLEKTDLEYIFTVSDAVTDHVIKTASIPIEKVVGSTLPDYLCLGDPHINYYNGSAKIANIRIQDKSGM